MLFLHEVHQVVGARARTSSKPRTATGGWPTLGRSDDARLLYFLHHAHGTGRAYNVVTITGVRDGAAWQRLVRAPARR